MFTDSSLSYRGSVGLVVALDEVLDALPTPEHFDFTFTVSQGVGILGSDWVVKLKRKSSLLSVSQKFTDSSLYCRGSAGLVVALDAVLDALSTPEHFDFASLVSRGVVILGFDWIDPKRGTSHLL